MTDPETWTTMGNYAVGCDGGSSCTYATNCDNDMITYDDGSIDSCLVFNPINYDVTNHSIRHSNHNSHNNNGSDNGQFAHYSITNTHCGPNKKCQ
ncbi:hypothetical protein PITC_071560 [Penicillium italicum]|uniref:Uncharacterized protein n=1 Tax=Penicillium italicum TaxID=40296 RepID=A0A0A2KNS3_PENIT|nr:hypothetical protein PITC_071560 [Penicillium italicum]